MVFEFICSYLIKYQRNDIFVSTRTNIGLFSKLIKSYAFAIQTQNHAKRDLIDVSSEIKKSEIYYFVSIEILVMQFLFSNYSTKL